VTVVFFIVLMSVPLLTTLDHIGTPLDASGAPIEHVGH
jgi:hypothetical protein